MKSFMQQEITFRDELLKQRPVNRGEWQATKVTNELMHTLEIRHQRLEFAVPGTMEQLQMLVNPNLPWAEDHFQERVSGEPLNPPPSNEWWPHAQAGNAEFKAEEKFSHTYPERFWPMFANVGGETAEGRQIFVPHVGVRFEYGDLSDLVTVLVNNPLTRQAYLPVWFPEDLTAAKSGERVPCTLGYHFLMDPTGVLDITYHIRSCDFVRHFRDDVYMAGRLLQWVVQQINDPMLRQFPDDEPWGVGRMIMNIGSFHCFAGDRAKMQNDAKEAKQAVAINYSAML